MAAPFELHADIEELVLSEKQINDKVIELAKQVDAEYVGKELMVVAILKGAFIFCSDLVRKMKTEHTVEFMSLSSYGAGGMLGERNDKIYWIMSLNFFQVRSKVHCKLSWTSELLLKESTF